MNSDYSNDKSFSVKHMDYYMNFIFIQIFLRCKSWQFLNPQDTAAWLNNENNVCFTDIKHCCSSSELDDLSAVQCMKEHDRYVIVDDMVYRDGQWTGQLQKKTHNAGHSSLFTIEVDLVCNGVLQIQMYPKTKHRLFYKEKRKTSNIMPYHVLVATNPTPTVRVENVTTKELVCTITLPAVTCGQQLGIVSCELNNTDHHSNRFQWQIWSPILGKTTSQGTLLLVNSTDNYVRGGYISPLYDKSKRSNKRYILLIYCRNTIGLLISLDENGSAKGEIQIKKIFRNQKEDDYVNLRLYVSEGNCLIITSISANNDSNNFDIDFIQFYGLYGYPDGFVIDKGKKYKVEDDLSKDRRIFNQHRQPMNKSQKYLARETTTNGKIHSLWTSTIDKDIAPTNEKDIAPTNDKDIAPTNDKDIAPTNDKDIALGTSHNEIYGFVHKPMTKISRLVYHSMRYMAWQEDY
ncbi:unnamed protein product [Mytilus coruscus]|uniref:Uncharacterized protein n=1 Tax=Mytilus coruscus TaxID=42192 RepID=A0A6J8DDR0_MYTCO|nr:unnamed protein product [Mytilus coruscus]